MKGSEKNTLFFRELIKIIEQLKAILKTKNNFLEDLVQLTLENKGKKKRPNRIFYKDV